MVEEVGSFCITITNREESCLLYWKFRLILAAGRLGSTRRSSHLPPLALIIENDPRFGSSLVRARYSFPMDLGHEDYE